MFSPRSVIDISYQWAKSLCDPYNDAANCELDPIPQRIPDVPNVTSVPNVLTDPSVNIETNREYVDYYVVRVKYLTQPLLPDTVYKSLVGSEHIIGHFQKFERYGITVQAVNVVGSSGWSNEFVIDTGSNWLVGGRAGNNYSGSIHCDLKLSACDSLVCN